jgi:cytochrome c biogenesis protein CcmG, thiol:disulfide interchange protein DsbE
MSTRPQAKSSPLLAVVIGLAVVVAVGVGLALARGGDDDDGGSEGVTSDAPAFGPIAVEGDPLPRLEDPDDDDAADGRAPVVEGEDPDGAARSVGGAGQTTLVVFLSHSCPHCQAEVPVLVDMAEDGAFDEHRLVGVLTGTNPEAPNFPPVAWLEREGWPGEILLDDERYTAADAFGVSAYPFLVVLDEGGRVVARASGELPPDVIVAMLEAAADVGGP